MAGPFDFLRNNNQAITQLGLGLLSGRTGQEQAALGAQGLSGAINQNKTVQWLQKTNPDLAAAVQQGAISPGDAWKMAYTQKLEAAKPKNNYIQAGKNLFNTNTEQWLTPPAGMGGDDAEYGLNPQYGVDANGNPVIVQLSKSGTSKQTALPDGVTLSKQPIKLDAGTHFVLLDPITRQPIGQVAKNLAEAEAQKKLGQFQGEATASAPGDIQAGQNALDLIGSIRDDPNRGIGTGISSVGNRIPATPGYDFQTKVDQAKSGAFLSAIEQMRGLGALSNAEGQTATAAVTRMNTATSEREFLAALSDYEKIIKQGIGRAQNRLSGQQPAQGPAQPPGSVVDYTDYFKQ